MSSLALLRAVGLVSGDISRKIAHRARNGRERWKRTRKSGIAKMRKHRANGKKGR